MAMEFKRRLPIPMEIREEMPLSASLPPKSRHLTPRSPKSLPARTHVRCSSSAPCFADREDSVLEYMNRLAKTAEEVKDKLIIIPRVYTNKPRTKGTGYKGLLHNPNPEAPDDLLEGVQGPSATCTCALLRKRASLPPMRCSTRPTTNTSSTC